MGSRKILAAITVIALIIGIASPAMAQNDPMRKLGRGIANCVSFPAELPLQISRVNNSDGPVAACTYGVVKGFVYGVMRAMTGVYETVSFPIPVPQGYKPIMTDPEFMMEAWSA